MHSCFKSITSEIWFLELIKIRRALPMKYIPEINNNPTVNKIIKFCFAGLICFGFDISLSYGFIAYGWPTIAANSFAALAATVLKYFISYKWVFRQRNAHKISVIISFITSNIFSIFLSLGIFELLSVYASRGFIFSKVLTVLVVATLNYVYVSTYIFKTTWLITLNYFLKNDKKKIAHIYNIK